MIETLRWEEPGLVLLDQRLLPGIVKYETLNSVEAVWNAIRNMAVRGAPAIGVTAAYGLYISIKDIEYAESSELIIALDAFSEYLKTSRPTAVNLFWALDRMLQTARSMAGCAPCEIKKALFKEARSIHEEDGKINRRIGQELISLLADGMGILTHCNAGALATTGYGTALSPIYLAKERGWHLKIYVDETRPRLQGSTLTAYELSSAGIDVTLITDSMAAVVMSQGKVDAVIVGCDRVAANGDTANKIGTFSLSISAKNFDIPFYVAAPTPTIDFNISSGDGITIEERDAEEVTCTFGVRTAPLGIKVYNPAFDVTPHSNITAIITEKGIIRPPFGDNLKQLIK